MLRISLAKLLTVKAAAVAIVAVGGGVAVAATAGVLPNPLDSAQGKPSANHSAGPDDSAKPQHIDGPKGSPAPNLDGLCKAYAAQPDGERGNALEGPAFQALITAAGSLDKVVDYCAARKLNTKRSTPSGKPSTRPNGAPSTKPTSHPGKPTASPTHP